MSRQSQRSQITQSQQQEESLSAATVDSAMKAVFTLDHAKKPIKHIDILNTLSYKLKRKQQNELWEKVKEKFQILGMTLCECENTQTKSFLLVANSPDLPFAHMFSMDEEKANRTLLVIVLSYIFMKDGMVAEDDLFRHLSNLQLGNEGSWEHNYFGNIKKKVQNEFVEQMYLVRTTVSGQEGAELRWGQRAHLEVPMMSILEFVCKVAYAGKTEPKHWVSQYERATNSEETADAPP